MVIRRLSLAWFFAAAAVALSSCDKPAGGPIGVSVVGGRAELGNPNLEPLNDPSAFLIGAVAQGLVRFDAGGQIEPALAQSWIVSDDGLRYTFRLARTNWLSGSRVTARQVVVRLRAAAGRSSRNALKPLLGSIAEIEPMTDDVLEISLKGPRPNFLQLLAQPELGIMRNGEGTGPYRSSNESDGSILLTVPDDEEEAEGIAAVDRPRDLVLRAEGSALAVARFRRGLADFVTGGTAGDLPIARAAALPAAAFRFDPVSGLFGLIFARQGDITGNSSARRALSMALDRAALVAALGVPNLQPRNSVLPAGIEELPAPALPDWTANPLPMRRELAAQVMRSISGGEPIKLRVAVPEGPGYRLIFAHIRRDWRAIGVDAERVSLTAAADVRLIDDVAPANAASWYLRRFTCAASLICSAEADLQLEAARNAPTAAERQALLAEADRTLTDLTPFIPLAAPVRWSLVSQRITGFQPNPFGRRFPGSLVAARR